MNREEKRRKKLKKAQRRYLKAVYDYHLSCGSPSPLFSDEYYAQLMTDQKAFDLVADYAKQHSETEEAKKWKAEHPYIKEGEILPMRRAMQYSDGTHVKLKYKDGREVEPSWTRRR